MTSQCNAFDCFWFGGLLGGCAESFFNFLHIIRALWRTGRDSNPRDGLPPTHFPGARLRPLGHLSAGSHIEKVREGASTSLAGNFSFLRNFRCIRNGPRPGRRNRPEMQRACAAASSVGVAAAKALACALGADTVPIAQNHMPGRSRQRDGTAHRCRCGASAKAADRQVSRLPNQGRAGLAPGIGIAAPSGIFPALRVYRPPRADGIMAS